MKYSCLFAAALVAAMFPIVVLGTGNDYNWIPAGRIDVGNPESEVVLKYWSDSPDAFSTGLNFFTGKRLVSSGRTVTRERCKVSLGSFWHKGE